MAVLNIDPNFQAYIVSVLINVFLLETFLRFIAVNATVNFKLYTDTLQ